MITNEPGSVGWRKSSYSAGDGDCIEVAWRTSSYSVGEGDCVEVAPTPAASLVRDSKNPTGSVLAFPAITWRGLELGLLDGRKGSS